MVRKTKAQQKAMAAPKKTRASPKSKKQPEASPLDLSSKNTHHPDDLSTDASPNSHESAIFELSLATEQDSKPTQDVQLAPPVVENEYSREEATTLEPANTIHHASHSASPSSRERSPDPPPELTGDGVEMSPPAVLIGDNAEASPLLELNTRKRSCSILPDSPEASNKRTKKTPSISSNRNGNGAVSPSSSQIKEAPAPIDKGNWEGFCEIESDPAYFSVLLRDMGVQDVTVREVFGLDMLPDMPQPIYGLILLFQYREFGNDDQASTCPPNVWFANQQPAQNSCATLAMMNILMNSPKVRIGEHLNQFKEFTSNFTPYHRGEALANFDFVKRIHNSFAKQMDILEGDKALSYKVRKAQRARAELEKTGKGKATESRRLSQDSNATTGSEENYENAANHYITFVPVGNDVWKFDGLDAQPTHMGTFNLERGESWMSIASNTISALMLQSESDQYGVLALAQSPLLALRAEACLALNTVDHIEARLNTIEPAWLSSSAAADAAPTASMFNVEAQLPLHPIPDSLKVALDSDDSSILLLRRGQLIGELNALEANIIVEVQSEAEENQKAELRRFDCGPVIKKWLEMLAENGHLEENLERHMPNRKGGRK